MIKIIEMFAACGDVEFQLGNTIILWYRNQAYNIKNSNLFLCQNHGFHHLSTLPKNLI